jgi:hypothetical protein
MADDLLKEGLEAFGEAVDYEAANRATYDEDVRFARMDKQWPEGVEKQRRDDERPRLIINKLKGLTRQVVNDNRQNKPQIKCTRRQRRGCRDCETVQRRDPSDRVFIRRRRGLRYSVESAVSGGFGYWRVGLDYSYDDSFDKRLTIDRILDPLRVYGDPASQAADSSDWNTAFIIERMRKKEFEREYKGAEPVNWQAVGEFVQVAEWWKSARSRKRSCCCLTAR